MDKQGFLHRFQLGRLKPMGSPLANLSGFRPCAVLVPLVVRPDGLQLILTQRAHHLRHHPGQISFPGGKFERHDGSLANTAIRETVEEIGIDADHIELIGQLPLYRTITRFEITPMIAFVDPGYQTSPDRDEVDNVFEVPLAEVLDHPSHFSINTHRGAVEYQVYFKPVHGRPIWGATAAILEQLRQLLAAPMPEPA